MLGHVEAQFWGGGGWSDLRNRKFIDIMFFVNVPFERKSDISDRSKLFEKTVPSTYHL